MAIEIRELNGDKSVRKDFLNLVDDIFAGDPHYIRPLDMDVGDRLDKKKNPFFDHGDATAFVAYRDGKPVGRISASFDQLHLDKFDDGAGFFGFFDTINDPEVAQLLIDRAAEWLRGQDLRVMRGPFSLNINEESGCLIDGFDTPPMIMMGHHRNYQGGLIEGAGLKKCMDLYAWDYEVGRVPKRAQRAHDTIEALPEVTWRYIDMKDMEGDMKLIMEVFNDAWQDNWGSVAVTQREIMKTAEDMKLIAIPEISRLVFIDGEIAAVAMALPNLNELIHDAKGQLIPFGAAKLLYRLRVRGPKSGRLIILGIRRKWRNIRRYAGLSAFLYVSMNQSAHLLGLRRGELSWTLEDNAPINVGIKMMGARIYKTYRIYEQAIA